MSYKKYILKQIQECNEQEKLLKIKMHSISDIAKRNLILIQLEQNRMFGYRLNTLVKNFEKSYQVVKI